MEGFAVPLVARGQRLGTLAIGRHQRHRHDPDEVAVLEDVARRAALAIDNARIHDERRTVAQHPPAVAAAAGAAARRRASASPPSTSRPGRGRGRRRLLRRGAAAGRSLAGRGRRRVRQGRAGGRGDRAGPRRHPGPRRTTASRCRRRSPGSTRRWSSGAAGVTARSPWRRSGRATAAGSTSRLHLAGHDRPVLVHGAGGATSSWATAEPHSACSTRSPPRPRRCRCARATRWSSIPTV